MLFLIYINDLPKITDRNAKVVLYADDTSIIVTNHNPERLQISLNKALTDIITWFETNLLSLNFDKSYCLHFQTKHHTDIKFDIKYLNKNIASTQNVKFLGLMVDNTLSWDAHIDQLLPRMNAACYAIRTIKALVSREVLRMVHFAYVHPILSYGIIFWGNTPNSIKIFRMQKKFLDL